MASKMIIAPAPARRGVSRTDWKTTGWQGVTLEAPPEWNLVAYSGDMKAGSLRLDNGEPPSRSALGMELRWSTPKGKITDADLEKRLDQYFGGIIKGAKRQKIVTESKSKAIFEERRPDRDVMRSFSWRADRRALGRIWHCRECGRLMIAQVVGGMAGDWSGLANDVLRSLECHSPEPGWRTWSLYDLLTQVPADFVLYGKPQLMNIYVQLMLARGQSLDTVSVEQWGVANVQLKGAYLDEWFRSKNAAMESQLRYESAETEAQGHPALRLTGRRTGLMYLAGQAVPQVARLQKPATHFGAIIWECPESNKVHLVQTFGRRAEPELVTQIVERTRCH
ncbi:MAG: hypothetical protein M3Y28_04300 [Armatimonadota bacterium]|nr:hypothetical protein [Armatimonadota bacterium]